MTRPVSESEAETRRARCLTEFSLPVLIAGALAFSAVLWLAIFAVL